MSRVFSREAYAIRTFNCRQHKQMPFARINVDIALATGSTIGSPVHNQQRMGTVDYVPCFGPGYRAPHDCQNWE
ncbi:hypothetical protein A0H81_00599 [Grifola frondosa]|uniref:Uncharacterized protein n=1 Tax=Grifola frondosa TaxID=5627 RepID=A0A1C7MPF9_GRIFR|nr:hypothetical protein A0H81_00599 [Grifola frondosa]